MRTYYGDSQARQDRVETGPVRFEDGNGPDGMDWPGLFIRGDECGGYADRLSVLIHRLEEINIAQILPMNDLKEIVNLLHSTQVKP